MVDKAWQLDDLGIGGRIENLELGHQALDLESGEEFGIWDWQIWVGFDRFWSEANSWLICTTGG